tara:strand:- start:9938 stop:10354 length:417 start_codon:yes stop_codon:yes gene_type:complete
MASELRVNTIKDASGNNSVATSTVAQGSAKAWIRYDGTSVTSDSDLAGVGDSFNYSSVVDGGTGQYTFAFTNNMGNNNWSGSALGKHDNDTTNNADNRQSILMHTITASSFITWASETSAATYNDSALGHNQVFGDLA